MKIVFPVFWISVFGAGTLVPWLGGMHAKAGDPPVLMKWEFLLFWIAGSGIVLWSCATLKRVRLDREFIYISNFRREISVPLSTISRVTENRWVNMHPVTIYFRVPTEFGDRIKFMPKSRFFGLWTSHPVVDELRRMAHLTGAE